MHRIEDILPRGTEVHTTNGISIGSAVFCTAHGRESLYFTMGRPFPLKIARLHEGFGPPSNTWFLESIKEKSILIDSAICAERTMMTDRPTDRPRATLSVTTGRTYVRSTAMRLKNNGNDHKK